MQVKWHQLYLDTVTVDLQNEDVQFRANGSQVKFPGFMKLYIEGTDDQTEETTKLLTGNGSWR